MLMFHSENDGSIPFNQAERMAEALAENNVHHRFLPYPDRGHIPLTESFVIEESVHFIREVEAGR